MSRIGEWFEERLPVAASLRRLVDEGVPGGAKFTYALGSTTLLTFLVQVFTGMLLLMALAPQVVRYLLASGYADNPAQEALTVSLLRLKIRWLRSAMASRRAPTGWSLTCK